MTSKNLDLPSDIDTNEEISICILGSVDSGKSTLTGLLTNPVIREFNEENLNKSLDDGDGKCRSRVLQYIHERETGRTSSITYNYMLLDKKRVISFLDLPGHEQYLKSSIRGVSNGYPDYALICIDKLTRMTQEHIQMALNLNIPIAMIYTKIDIVNKDKLKKNMQIINKYIRDHYNKKNYTVHSNKDIETVLQYNTHYFPSFKISCKTGEGLHLLREFIKLVPKQDHIIPNAFLVDHIYNVQGYGTVVSGMCGMEIIKGDNLLIGPFKNDEFKKIKVRTLHDDYRRFVDVLDKNRRGCVCIKFVSNKNNKDLKNQLRSGMIIVQNINDVKLSKQFNANVSIFHHSTTITPGYQTYMNGANIKESITFKDIIETYNTHSENDSENQHLLRSEYKALVALEFTKNKYCLLTGQKFIFREGKSIGIGSITDF